MVAFTVKLKVVVFETPSPVPVTLMVYVPTGVKAVVVMVKMVEQGGLQVIGEKAAVAPEGRPDTE